METNTGKVMVLFRFVTILISMFFVLCLSRDAGCDEASDAFEALKKADDLWRDGRLAMAQKGYEELLSRYPTWWLPMLKMAVLAMDMGLKEKAFSLLQRCETLPADQKVLQFIKRLLFLADLRDVGEDAEQDVRIMMAKAKVLEQRKDFATAINTYRLILKRCDTCHAARFRLGVLLAALGDTRGALEMLSEGEEKSLFSLRWKKAKRAYGSDNKKQQMPP